MDILEEIPFEKWPYLQEKLLVNWPRNFAGYHALEKSRQHPELRDSFQFKVYCPYGDVDNGLPDATYLAQLKPTDIQRVGETWFGDYANSYTYFSNLVTFSYGLYSRSSDELLAWVFTNEQDLIRHLYCEKNHRKKGYGEYLLKYIINDQLRQGKDLCCFVSGSNEPSLRLFKKHGFQVVDDFHYATVKYAQEC
ncbi:Glycine N-acyltransferase [Operophtera brumata]|uniref:Glycine N-acyltransferase n=1 Tax=Operophtera brumata TaxID=104452 RepID=A0A0L7L0J6_OPEBR|nr:Glycine N-acyltransferase [Operophtera brumata]